MVFSSDKQTEENILHLLKNLEARVAAIEDRLNIESKSTDYTEKPDSKLSPLTEAPSDNMEFHIGEFWFAKVGIVILALGIAFLLTFPYQNIPAGFPIIIGYLLVTGIAVISHLWRKTFSLISRYLLGGGLILLYFTTLRLHYFSVESIIENSIIETSLLLLVVCINLYVALRRKSVYLSIVTFTLGFITAIISALPLFMFTILSVLAGLCVFIQKKYQWHYLLHFGIILTYFSHFIWFINNPFLGHKIQLVSTPLYNIYFILFYAVIFSLASLLRPKDLDEDNNLALSMFLNSFGSYGLYLIITLTQFQDHLALNHFLAAILFLSFSVLYWKRGNGKYTTSLYAIVGYMSLSVAIIALFELPDSFIWLSWQSLLVITTAIWYRSKFIIFANFFIYIIIFISYLFIAGTVHVVSLSFGFVALISARLLNWQKERLELKTELMRTSYLAAAFFMFPYALYHTVPGGYVSLSWVGVAGFYYLLSLILKNKKYRWMALLTFMLAVVYLLLIGTINFDPVFRLISFIVLGLTLIIVSLLYTKFRNKINSQNSTQT